jgi:hypothetical protein
MTDAEKWQYVTMPQLTPYKRFLDGSLGEWDSAISGGRTMLNSNLEVLFDISRDIGPENHDSDRLDSGSALPHITNCPAVVASLVRPLVARGQTDIDLTCWKEELGH